MKRVPLIKNSVSECKLPTNEDLGKLSVEERIKLGNKLMLESKRKQSLEMSFNNKLKKSRNLSAEAKIKLYQEYGEEQAKIHNKIFGQINMGWVLPFM